MKKSKQEKNISVFSTDSKTHGGYMYTNTDRYSSIVSNEHITNNTNLLVNIKGKHVYDIGCGDGTYTKAIFYKGKASSILGIEPAIGSVNVANKNNNNKQIRFEVGNIYSLSKKKKRDIAILRGVLHHLYHPEKAVKEVSKIANTVLIIEPNGFNPFLKLVEKFSKYHIEHEEKSYPPPLVDKWIEKNKGEIINRKFAAIVPFFCPKSLAVFLKAIQPIVESLPIINKLLCTSYYVVYKTK